MRWIIMMLCLALAACATRPPITPAMLADDPGMTAKGTRLTWSGVVLSLRRQGGHTVLKVLAYPADRQGRPQVTAPPLGQFLADRPGELSEAAYGPGRQLRVTGPLLGHADGQVGGQPYRFPAIGAEELVVWGVEGSMRRAPDVRFGVGVGSGGGGWGGVGIGF